MKKVIFIAALLLFIGTETILASEGGKVSFFEGTLSEAIEESARVNKPVLMKGYAVWCGACKKLESTTFADEAVVKHLNENFVVIRVDMEKGEGPEVKKRFKISGYPTMVVLDSKGNETKRLKGFMNAEKFLAGIKE